MRLKFFKNKDLMFKYLIRYGFKKDLFCILNCNKRNYNLFFV